MIRLPAIIDFDEMDHPGLIDIFHGIDVGIAAIVASDPAFRPKPSGKRRRPHATSPTRAKRHPGRVKQAA